MAFTTDPEDTRLHSGIDKDTTPIHDTYLILSEDERKKGFVRPIRRTYIHMTCGTITRMAPQLAETYARDPKFYGTTYCCGCQKHLSVLEFRWDQDGEVVGS